MDASDTFRNIPPDKQRRVLEEASSEFARHGFLGASMNRLAARLGIAKGSIFKYFGNKEGLFAQVFTGSVDLLSGSLRQARDETAGLPLAERLERVLLVGAQFARSHPNIYRIYLKMLFNEDFPLRERLLAQVRALSARFLTPIIEQAKASGELPQSLDVPLAVFMADAVLERFVQLQAAPAMDAGPQIGPTFGLDDPETSRLTAARLARMLAGGFTVG
ncbi:TetR/AcrR family transcriptional regulator [Fundidesulfovibrio agrisoli]|uniref:TetR/AcrR family transcriptional regulator n=1 Tax=Fundidesulfovibrio agrisoli TaxID=2922717 RepID=UPI001FAC6CB3|nr:TetR/AcrR family transcriptional regulator [Fundidesulfovibrio agrisoli]